MPFLGGADYGIAEVAAYAWIARHHWAEMKLEDWAHPARWFSTVGARPAVMRGMQVPAGARLD